MIIHPWIPEQGFVSIAPKEVPGADILIRKLDLFLWKGPVDGMIPMFDIQFVCIEQGNKDSGTGDTKSIPTAEDLY
jgi:hypothetical protein